MPSKIRIWAVAFLVVGIGLCRLLPEFNGPVRVALAIAISGIASYLAFLMIVDVPNVPGPMAGWPCRWQQAFAASRGPSVTWSTRLGRDARHCSLEGRELPGCRFISVRRSGLASRCAFSTRSRIISRAIRTEAAVASFSPDAFAVAGKQPSRQRRRPRCEAGLLQSPLLCSCAGQAEPLNPTLLAGLDLLKFRKRLFEFLIEQPHRIKKCRRKTCRRSCPVSLPKGEDAVVSQISQDPGVGIL